MTCDGFDRPYLALVDVDDLVIRRVVFWDEDQFDDAVDELHRCWVERGGPSVLGRVLVVHDDDGSVVNGGLCVATWNDDWLQLRQELFDLDQWDTARARFEELSA